MRPWAAHLERQLVADGARSLQTIQIRVPRVLDSTNLRSTGAAHWPHVERENRECFSSHPESEAHNLKTGILVSLAIIAVGGIAFVGIITRDGETIVPQGEGTIRLDAGDFEAFPLPDYAAKYVNDESWNCS